MRSSKSSSQSSVLELYRFPSLSSKICKRIKKRCKLSTIKQSQLHALTWVVSDELHKNRIQQLLNLIEKQSQIEEEIVETTAILSNHYDKGMKLFRTVLSDRLNECDDTLNELKTLANEQEWQGTVGEHA